MSSFRFASLGSGSGGNCTVVAAADTTVLVDCGFSALETERRLRQLNVAANKLDAILVTHEHFDHRKGVGVMSRRWKIPVYASPGTSKALEKEGLDASHIQSLRSGRSCRIGGLEALPVSVPHDAAEPLQFVIRHDRWAFGILTDAGHVPESVLEPYRECDALLLESNHDLGMLMRGNDPPTLKQRIASPEGHLSNDEAGRVVSALAPGRLSHLVIGHTSKRNNTRDLQKKAFDRYAEQLSTLSYATQQEGTFGWVSVN